MVAAVRDQAASITNPLFSSSVHQRRSEAHVARFHQLAGLDVVEAGRKGLGKPASGVLDRRVQPRQHAP